MEDSKLISKAKAKLFSGDWAGFLVWTISLLAKSTSPRSVTLCNPRENLKLPIVTSGGT